MQQVTVALPLPIRKNFTYLLPKGVSKIKPGVRVLVPFRKQQLIGFACQEDNISEDLSAFKLKRIERILDEHPIFPDTLYRLLVWAANYYQTPLGMALEAALPVPLRQGKEARIALTNTWHITDKGLLTDPTTIFGKRQRPLLETLIKRKEISEGDLKALNFKKASLDALVSKSLAQVKTTARLPQIKKLLLSHKNISLTTEQLKTIDRVVAAANSYGCYLLQGPTNCGKTEVYIEIIRRLLKTDEQVLYMVPEIGLSPQTVARLAAALDVPLGLFHSGMNKNDRLQNYLLAAAGKLRILVGTRSSIFIPLPKLRCIFIDEEQDSSYKQQDGFHYNAKHLAIKYARLLNIPIIMGSATPSLESLHNTQRNYYHLLPLPKRTLNKKNIRLLDLSERYNPAPLPKELIAPIQKELEEKRQVLIFVNRRGFATVVRCQACGWMRSCESCERPMVLHKNPPMFICHLCGRQAPVTLHCPDCQSDQLLPFGAGTQRIEKFLHEQLPAYPIMRIDSDSMQSAKSYAQFYSKVRNTDPCILIGTKMLAKGHDFSNILLGIIVNCDQGLINPDFHASEAFAQTLIQVIGRIGRRDDGVDGKIIIPTCYPQNAFLLSLITGGYADFAARELKQRQLLGLPPYSYLAYLRAESRKGEMANSFLKDLEQQTANKLSNDGQGSLAKDILGPNECIIAKKADYYRSVLIIKSSTRENRAQITSSIAEIATTTQYPGIRWFLDIDPQEAP